MVKINKMIKKETREIFLAVYVIYGSLANLYAYRAVYVCSIMSLTSKIGLYLSVLSKLIINLMYKIIKYLYYNDQHNFRV